MVLATRIVGTVALSSFQVPVKVVILPAPAPPFWFASLVVPAPDAFTKYNKSPSTYDFVDVSDG